MTFKLKRIGHGALAGAAATAPMTGFMKAVHACLPADQQDPIPPVQIARRVVRRAGGSQAQAEVAADHLSMPAHFAFGAGIGALAAQFWERLRAKPILAGVGVGLSVWACSYLGWLPATGLYRSPHRDRWGRHLMMTGAHVVWGAVFGSILAAMIEHTETQGDKEQS